MILREKEKFKKDFEKIYLFLYWKEWEKIQDCVRRMIQFWIFWDQEKEYDKFRANIELILPKFIRRNKKLKNQEIENLWLNYWSKILTS